MIALGADHAGWQLKEEIKAWLLERNVELMDYGTHSPDPVDYPDYAAQVAEAVAGGKAQRGVLVCGTGIGMAMAANKVPGVRAAFCPDLFTARMSREHRLPGGAPRPRGREAGRDRAASRVYAGGLRRCDEWSRSIRTSPRRSTRRPSARPGTWS
jgi:Ribose/Galactose Isomerase